MGKLFKWLMKYYLATLPRDTLSERLHVHVVKIQRGKIHALAKIWLESNGEKNIEVAYSSLRNRELNDLLNKINDNWDLVISQVKHALSGESVEILKL